MQRRFIQMGIIAVSVLFSQGVREDLRSETEYTVGDHEIRDALTFVQLMVLQGRDPVRNHHDRFHSARHCQDRILGFVRDKSS